MYFFSHLFDEYVYGRISMLFAHLHISAKAIGSREVRLEQSSLIGRPQPGSGPNCCLMWHPMLKQSSRTLLAASGLPVQLFQFLR